MVDEHYYESTGWFMHHRNYYDSYDRKAPKVYLGEYAASTDVKRPNVETALAEALYLTDVERNGDVVEMTSYAPMLAKDGHHNWDPDMIYFSNTEVRPTTAYEVQRLFSVYGGDRYVTTKLMIEPVEMPGTTQKNLPDVSYRLGASLVRDSKTGHRYLKLVNAMPDPLVLKIDGLSLPEGAKGETFCGSPKDQQVELKPLSLSGSQLTLPPYSLTAIQVQ